jgi:EAL domain-containing protein (putative c-di-GMP-specific phosphodiesterase class I)
MNILFYLISGIIFSAACFGVMIIKGDRYYTGQLVEIILANSELLVIVVKMDGTVVKVNQLTEQALGQNEAFLKGKKFYQAINDQVIKEYIAQNLAEVCDSTPQAGVFWEKTLNLQNGDKSDPFSFKKQFIYDVKGRPRLLVLIGAAGITNGGGEPAANAKCRRLAISRQELLVKYLKQALANGELELHYQPLYNRKQRGIEGFEALLRWKNPLLGIVSPVSFIKVAEETGLIAPIGEWALLTACQFIKRLHDRGYSNCGISVNISVIQLRQPDFVTRLQTILQEVGLAPQYLELELTESVLMQAVDVVYFQLKLLKSIGVRIALDDFGMGYSSLSYLQRFKVDTIKIDKSFIQGLLQSKKSRILTKSIITLGSQLGLKVIAEGVETQAQVDCLTDWDCDTLQGYFYGKPVAEKEAMEMLE